MHARGPHVRVQLSRHRRNGGGGAAQPPAGVHAPERRPPPGHADGSHRRHVGERRGPLCDLGVLRRTEPVRRLVLSPLPGSVHHVQRGFVLRPGRNRQRAQPEFHRGPGAQGGPPGLPTVHVETLVGALGFRWDPGFEGRASYRNRKKSTYMLQECVLVILLLRTNFISASWTEGPRRRFLPLASVFTDLPGTCSTSPMEHTSSTSSWV